MSICTDNWTIVCMHLSFQESWLLTISVDDFLLMISQRNFGMLLCQVTAFWRHDSIPDLSEVRHDSGHL